MTTVATTSKRPCSGCSSQSQSQDLDGVRSISLSAHTALFEALASDLEQEQVQLAASDAPAGRLLATPGLITQMHSVPGGVLVTAATATGSQAFIKAAGSVAAIYHASTLRFSLDQAAQTVTVQLNSQQPVQGERTWHFAFGDVVTLPDGRFTASSVELDAPKMAAEPQVALDQRCITYCNAQSIVGILISCLPALVLGPEGYLACAIAGAAFSAQAILCIMQCEGWG